MKALATRIAAAASLAILVWIVLAAAAAPRTSSLEPKKLVILSTTDVRGKTSPCG